MGEEFCVVCGRTDRALEDGVCAPCFADRHPLVTVRASPSITLCPTCGSRKERDRWTPSTSGRFLGADDLNPFLDAAEGVGIRRVHWR